MNAGLAWSLEDKLIDAAALPDIELARRLASLPRPLVFTNGVFDVLHRGHVTYLANARAVGGSLVVALNTDASARRLGKGPDRPLNRDVDRALVKSDGSYTYFAADIAYHRNKVLRGFRTLIDVLGIVVSQVGNQSNIEAINHI